MAHWLKDTLIRSLGIWHVFSKEETPPPPHTHTHPHRAPTHALLALIPHRSDSKQKDDLRDDLCHSLLTCQRFMVANRKLPHGLFHCLCLISMTDPPSPPIFGDSMQPPATSQIISPSLTPSHNCFKCPEVIVLCL